MELIKSRLKQMKQISNAAYTQEETAEAIVPDVKPDILRVIGTTAVVCIREKSAGAGSVKVSGEVNTCVFYLSESGEEVVSLKGTMPFVRQYEVAGGTAQDVAVAQCKLISAQTTVVNPRKVSVKVQFLLESQSYGAAEVMICDGYHAEDSEGICAKLEPVEQNPILTVTEKKIAINEEIRITGGAVAPTDRLYRSEVQWQTEDCKVLTNKVMLRGSAKVKIVCLSEKGTFTTQSEYSLPFSQIIESENTDLNDVVTVSYQTLQIDASIQTRQDGSAYLGCELLGNAMVFVRRKSQSQVITDLYSTAFETTSETETIEVPMNAVQTEYPAANMEKLEIDGVAARVHDVAAYCEVMPIKEGDTLVEANVYLQVLYENTVGALHSARGKMGLNTSLPKPCEGQVQCSVMLDEVDVSCDNEGGLNATVKGRFLLEQGAFRKLSQMSKCEVMQSAPKKKERSASLILRAYDGRESVWEIAKRYNTTPHEILSANKIAAENELTSGRLILIPFVV